MEVRTRLYQDVALRIAQEIRAGVYPPGTRLPGERELAEMHDVSRVTIREAEIALEAQGYISIKPGSGVYVRKDADKVGDCLPDVTAFDLTTARSVIEAEGAALAAVNISAEDLGTLEQLVADMASEDGEDFDRQFHLTIARATGNSAIEHLVGELWRMRSEIPQVSEVYASVCSHHAPARAQEHRAIFDALKAGDPAAARMAMREHFHRLFEAMLAARENAAIAELQRSLGEDRQRFMQTTLI